MQILTILSGVRPTIRDRDAENTDQKMQFHGCYSRYMRPAVFCQSRNLIFCSTLISACRAHATVSPFICL